MAMNTHIKQAVHHGWTINDGVLIPPSNFECKTWHRNDIMTKYDDIDISVPQYIYEDDVRYFGTKIKDDRIQKGLKLGWSIVHRVYEENNYYTLSAPDTFSCSQNHWCAIYKEHVYNDNIIISIPHWFNNDNVLNRVTWS